MLDRLKMFLGFEPSISIRAHEHLLEASTKEARTRGYREALDDPFHLDPDAFLSGNQNAARHGRKLGEAPSTKDFTPPHREKIRQNSIRAYHLKGHPQNEVEIAVDFIIGEGLKPKVKNTDADKDGTFQDWLDDFWEEPENAFEARHGSQVTAALVEGEFFLQVAGIDPTDGKVRFGYIEPKSVRDVQQDRFRRDVVAVVENPKDDQAPFQFAILNALPPEVEIEVAAPTEDGRVPVALRRPPVEGQEVGEVQQFDGACFFLGVNRIAGARRGKPDLVPVLDYLDEHDDIIFRASERARALTALLLDVTVEGASSPDEITEQIRQLGFGKTPVSLQTTGHSDKVSLEYKSPDLGTEQIAVLERILRLVSYGSKGYPEAFSGAGDETNRSTLAEQNSIPARRLGRRQKEIVAFFACVLRFAIRQAIKVGVLKAGEKGKAPEFRIEAPEIGSTDQQKVATAISSIVQALVTAASDSIISRELASEVITQALREAGFEFADDLTGVDEERIEEGKAMFEAGMGGSKDADGDGKVNEGGKGKEKDDPAKKRKAFTEAVFDALRKIA